jgi:membrane peptidoglycan carboxypeptidase
MHKVSQVVKFRQRAYARDHHRPWLRLGLLFAVFFSLVLVSASFTGIGYAVSLTNNLPPADVLPAMLEPPNGALLNPTRLLDRSGEHVLLTLQDPASVGRQYIFIPPKGQPGVDQVPAYLVNATTLEFDPDFWSNPGFKLDGAIEGTHPTLAQLLVSDLILQDEPPSILRNIRERLMAAQITSRYGRDQVLEWYLNSAWYSGTIYGADAASRVYFGKPAAQLSLAESAMLVAISEKPSIDPRSGSQLLKQQQELIILKMLVKGLVTGGEAQQALEEELHFQLQAAATSLAPGFTGVVLEQLSEVMPLERLYRGGYDIVTTLDFALQAQVDCAANAYLSRLNGSPAPTTTLDGSACESASLLPSLPNETVQIYGAKEAEVVLIDPHSGQILALVGQAQNALAPAALSSHQAGNILSPFLYLTAFTRGMSPASLIWDIPPTDGNLTPSQIQEQRADEIAGLYHGPVRLRQVMVNDYQGGAVEVLQQVEPKNVIITEREFGISTNQISQIDDPTLADLTSQNVSLLDTVHAYAVLANQGVMAGQTIFVPGQNNPAEKISASSILAIKGANGQISLDWSAPEQIPVASPQLAYLTTHVLADEKSRWELLGHPNGLEIGRPAAGKVGLGGDASSAWAVGYIPQLAVGVWIGSSSQNGERLTVDAPAALWHALMSYAASRMPVEEFLTPPGITLVQVCDPSGLLPTPLCPNIVQEVFLEGNQPTQLDDLFQQYAIDRETGSLATIFTPADLVERKVFMNIPQQAKAWAKTAGVPLPPDTYDSISLPPQALPGVSIFTPQMFDHVHGQVDISGNAGGEGFSYYRLEVGKGLNPDEWFQIGEDVDTPVEAGLLGRWDTAGLKGLYVVRLMVVREDMRFDEAFLQVTIDNTPPVVNILAPQDGQTFTFHLGEPIQVNVSASDDLVLQRVEFYVDGKLVSTLTDPPYLLLWDEIVGMHTLMVEAFDLAGNESHASVSVVVNK